MFVRKQDSTELGLMPTPPLPPAISGSCSRNPAHGGFGKVGAQKPHEHKDPAKRVFRNPPSRGPYTQIVGSFMFMAIYKQGFLLGALMIRGSYSLGIYVWGFWWQTPSVQAALVTKVSLAT